MRGHQDLMQGSLEQLLADIMTFVVSLIAFALEAELSIVI